ncbi:MAG: amidohydrolase [bacterium]
MAGGGPASVLNAGVYLGGGRTIERGFVSWSGDTLTAVGPMDEYRPVAGAVEHDLGGCLVLPGLVDCHLHLVGYARALIRIDLSGTASLEDGLGLIADFISRLPKGAWLKGRGWDKQRWGMDAFPVREMLDRVSPENPVGLWSRDGHLMWANSLAIEASGAEDPSVRVDGGEIDRDEKGRPTGIFREHAVRLITSLSSDEDDDTVCRAIEEACGRLRRYGLTGLHVSESEESYERLRIARERGIVNLNLYNMLETEDPGRVEAVAATPGVDCVKVLVDGALGSQTASMLEPYCGSDSVGVTAVPRDRLLAIVSAAIAHGKSLAVHAIGDRANRDVLDVFEEVAPLRRDRPLALRVEHAQLLHPDDMPRFGSLDVIASMQPIHLVSDIKVAEKYWGERSRGAYAWGSIRRGGGTLAFGSDAPIEEPDPLKGIHAAVTRRVPGDKASGSWYPGEGIEVWEAVDAYTRGAARASSSAAGAGALKPGYRADLTILTRNILSPEDPDAILEAGIAGTVAAGDALLS